jgi:peptide/nickel transport system substrate-binding protein
MTPEASTKSHGREWAAIAAAVVVTLAMAMPRVVDRNRSRTAASADTLVASIRAEPRSFNRYAARDLSTSILTFLMHQSLVRINRVTNDLEPELAERWELLPDRQTYRLWLRRNVRFSDGAPFSAEDVAFSFRAIYDKHVESELADSLQINGRSLTVVAESPDTVTIRFPAPFSAGLRMLDGVPIYPRHRLESALSAGTLRSAWGLSTPPGTIAGLGPFMLRTYEPGQRLVFDRNPYFRRAGDQSAKLSHVVLEVVPDQAAEVIGLETGAIDITQSELRPSDIPLLKRAGRVQLTEAGIGLDGDLFWVNLTSAKARDPRGQWLQHPDFRRAVAYAVDRRAFVDTVYLGEAVPADSIVSPGNRQWHTQAGLPEYDPATAKRLLSGLLRDRDSAPMRFTLLTQKGNTSLERGASVLRDSLAPIGVQVDVVAMEVGALIDHIRRGDYDAAYFRLLTTDTDPALNLDFWLSSGSAHMWNPEQVKPSTKWEADVDRLMNEMSTTPDLERRVALFSEAQRILAREVPALCFAFPRLTLAVNARVDGGTPAPFRPPLLWNPAVLEVR